LRLQGKRMSLHLHLPAATDANGYYRTGSVRLNGAPSDAAIAWQALKDDNRIDIDLATLVPGDQSIRRVNANPYEESPAVFGPRDPSITKLERKGRRAVLDIDGGPALDIYRDGKLVAANIPGKQWTDDHPAAASCYAVEAIYPNGNRSHHSMPRCLDKGVEVLATDPRVRSNVALAQTSERFPLPHLGGWGKPGDSFRVDTVHVTQPGRYAVQVKYHNGANQVNLGISGGVKWLALKDQRGRIVAQGVVQLPHAPISKKDTPVALSTPLYARLAKGHYLLELTDFFNMSYLQSNSSFSAAGGVEGPSNRFDIYGVRLSRIAM
jgi:hypothetical protein